MLITTVCAALGGFPGILLGALLLDLALTTVLGISIWRCCCAGPCIGPWASQQHSCATPSNRGRDQVKKEDKRPLPRTWGDRKHQNKGDGPFEERKEKPNYVSAPPGPTSRGRHAAHVWTRQPMGKGVPLSPKEWMAQRDGM